ncbi:hypothetical protein ACEWY4_011939 [Coilia grayii]|uniref:RasGAP-activating-like protein 1 n=1 Tax=Coilia grayii TaxID=363190 RepID=A0ABD1JZ36_9TELE
MAKNTSLYFRIVEGRNLPAKDVSGTSDPYCIVKVDNEVVARTATVWKNLNPFWGEEYTLHLPMGFHMLSFYVMDEDTIGHDDVIGKISLTKEVIAAQSKGLDSWLNLTRVDPDEEVQGEIHVELELHREAQRTCLRCHVIQARDLAPRDISGTSDPFTRILYNNHSAETSIIKKTRFPHWGETLELSLEKGEEEEGGCVTLEVWDWDMVGKNDFLGKVEIPLACLHRAPPLQGWFRLLPLGNTEDDAGGRLGALRLKVRLAEERILPSVYYQPLIDLLVESVISPAEVEDPTLLTLLEEVTTVESRQDVAMTLVKIYLGQGLVAVGMLYLHEVLRPIINRIFEDKKYVELDPCKIDLNRSRRISFKGSVSEAEIRESSVGLLQGYLCSIVEAIVGSVAQCPLVMRLLFKQLHKRVEEQFPEPQHEDVKYLAISGFFFLRFFAPAILSPKLFHLRDHHADTRTSRTLLLLAKAVQSVGNLGLQLGHGKEQWMAPLHPTILCSVASVKDFLDKLIDVDHDNKGGVPAVGDGEGGLPAQAQGPGPQLLKRLAFKKRYFWLSSETLSYAKTPDWQVRASIPVPCVCAVERVDENAFQLQNVMQVVTQDSEGQLNTMYLQCKNVNELNQWLSAIRKVSIYRAPAPLLPPRSLPQRQVDLLLTARPHSRTHSAVTLGDWSDPLDPDAEAQTIYKQLLQGRDKLRKQYLEPEETEGATDKPVSSGQPSDGLQRAAQTTERAKALVTRLLDVVMDLERTHNTYQRREREEASSLILPS